MRTVSDVFFRALDVRETVLSVTLGWSSCLSKALLGDGNPTHRNLLSATLIIQQGLMAKEQEGNGLERNSAVCVLLLDASDGPKVTRIEPSLKERLLFSNGDGTAPVDSEYSQGKSPTRVNPSPGYDYSLLTPEGRSGSENGTGSYFQ